MQGEIERKVGLAAAGARRENGDGAGQKSAGCAVEGPIARFGRRALWGVHPLKEMIDRLSKGNAAVAFGAGEGVLFRYQIAQALDGFLCRADGGVRRDLSRRGTDAASPPRIPHNFHIVKAVPCGGHITGQLEQDLFLIPQVQQGTDHSANDGKHLNIEQSGELAGGIQRMQRVHHGGKQHQSQHNTEN